jgi:uncharacterized protein
MQQIIEKLLILQDRDRRILHIREQLARVQPERQAFPRQGRRHPGRPGRRQDQGQTSRIDRKKLELEVESKKQQIERYALQQFQTKKNEEYRALAHEIDTCKADISKLEDGQLELMEQAETLQKKPSPPPRGRRGAQMAEAQVARTGRPRKKPAR